MKKIGKIVLIILNLFFLALILGLNQKLALIKQIRADTTCPTGGIYGCSLGSTSCSCTPSSHTCSKTGSCPGGAELCDLQQWCQCENMTEAGKESCTVCVGRYRCNPKCPDGYDPVGPGLGDCIVTCDSDICANNQECKLRSGPPPPPGSNPPPSESPPPGQSVCEWLEIYEAVDPNANSGISIGSKIDPSQAQLNVPYKLVTGGNLSDAAQFKITVNGAAGAWQYTQAYEETRSYEGTYTYNFNPSYFFPLAYTFTQLGTYQIESQIKYFGDNVWVGGPSCTLSFSLTSAPSPSPSPSPSTPPPPTSPSPSPNLSLVCSSLSRDPSGILKLGSTVKFTCTNQAVNASFNHYDYRYQIDGGAWQSPTGWTGAAGATPDFTITQPGTYLVQCRACTSTDASKCTIWGAAQGWLP